MKENTKRVIDEQTLKLLNSGIIINDSDRKKLDNVIEDIEKIYKTAISNVKEEREKQYAEFVPLLEKYGKILGATKYTLQLTKEEYLYLKALILKKISYDRQNLFIGLLVRDDFFNKYDTDKAYNKTSLFDKKEVEVFSLDINEITRISHLTSLNEIQGLDEKADRFANIVKKIGDVSKMFDIYNMKGEELSNRSADWIQGFTAYDDVEVVDAEQVK